MYRNSRLEGIGQDIQLAVVKYNNALQSPISIKEQKCKNRVNCVSTLAIFPQEDLKPSASISPVSQGRRT